MSIARPDNLALRRKGVRAIVVTIHQGGSQGSYTGATQPMPPALNGPAITDIVRRLDDEVDVVVSGHAHAFTNTLLPTASGKPILVTQAFSNSTAYGDIELAHRPCHRRRHLQDPPASSPPGATRVRG